MSNKVRERSRHIALQASFTYYKNDKDGNIKPQFNGMTEVDILNQWAYGIEYVANWLTDKDTNKKALNGVEPITAKRILMIYHDGDIDKKTKALKPVHMHMVIDMDKPTTKTQIMTLFGLGRVEDVAFLTKGKNELDENKRVTGAIAYLVHGTPKAMAEDKRLYSFSRVKGFPAGVDVEGILDKAIKASHSGKDIDLQEIREGYTRDIMAGRKRLEDIQAEYLKNDLLGAMAWVTDKKKYYKDAREQYLKNLTNFYTTHPICKTTTYITGGGGLGKTQLAKLLASKYERIGGETPHYIEAQQKRVTFDPAGQYEGQASSIINEAKGSSWSLEGLLDALDPINANNLSSRNTSKPYLPEHVFLTTSDPLDVFIRSLFLNYAKGELGSYAREAYGVQYPSNLALVAGDTVTPYSEDADSIFDKVWQIRRRFAIVIKLHDAGADIDVLDYSKRSNWYEAPHGVRLPDDNNYHHLYKHFATNVNYKDADTFGKLYDEAVKYYYKLNANILTINPDTVERPQF